MARKAILAFLLIFASLSLTAQEAASPTVSDRASAVEERLRIAMSSTDYPVTPGDTYELTYRQATGEMITRNLTVNGNYSIDLGIFGKIDASDLVFTELKTRTEKLIVESYTRSLPTLTMTATGVFRVAVRGEVTSGEYSTAWGLTRLSEVVEAARSPNASIRIVEVASRNGVMRRYDLFKARRLGAADQNPLVRPGDIITLRLATRIVGIAGEVWQPGSYELGPQEGLLELIELCGGGLTTRAELNRVRIDHATGGGVRSDYISIPAAYESGPVLQYGDSVFVPSKAERRPVVWFEGAVLQGQARQASAPEAAAGAGAGGAGAEAGSSFGSESTSGRIPCQVLEGQMLSDALISIRDSIAPNADLSSATLLRQGTAAPIPVNLQALLSGADHASDLPLAANDRIFIPILQSTVSVSGAVNNRGVYPYQPGMPAWYYINLAAGFDLSRNKRGSFEVIDPRGKRRKPADPIRPGDQIYVPSTTFEFNVMQYGPLITSFTATILSVLAFFITLGAAN